MAPPNNRYLHSAVYDPATNRMIVFGGSENCTAGVNDAWVLSNANGLGGAPAWTLLSPSGSAPVPRYWHSAVYNTATNRMTVFAGVNGPYYNDVWVMANANGVGTPVWIQLSPTGGPPPARAQHTAVYDPATNRMVLFGGFTTISGVANDAWVLSNADGTGGTPAWTQLSPTGTLPSARRIHSAIYNAANNRMVVFAGIGSSYFNDTWVLASASGIIDIPVTIDIRPGTALNNISLANDITVPVAILSTATFNAPTDVDKTSLTFGHAGTEASLSSCDVRGRDVNGDGRADLVCRFTIKATAFVLGDTLGYLKGASLVGNTLHGSDTVHITK